MVRQGPVVIEFKGKAASKLLQLRNITDLRDEAEVVADALQIYEWVLREQAAGVKFSDKAGNTLRNFVQDREKAKSYFETKR